ncbi:MAG: glycerol kinase [Thermoplasmata archaeon]|nr:MAG: glycerol kinase [Thermoplasmata archaeon]
MKRYILAIDEGTTGVRGIVFDRNGDIVSQEYETISQIFPHPGWCEQNPEEIWEKCRRVMKGALEKIEISDIEAVGITTQRTTNLLWDRKSGKPIYNAITWQDTRTADICRKKDAMPKMRLIRGAGHLTKQLSKLAPFLRKTTTGALLVSASSLSFSPVTSLAHTRWILDNVEGAQKRAERGDVLFGTMDTWLIWKLTGGKVHATDFSSAGATNMFDPFSAKWSDLFLDTFDIPDAILPEVRETCGEFGQMEREILGAELPIRSAVGDQSAAMFADGCFNPGDVKCTHGTGSFINMNVGHRPTGSMHRLLPLIAWKIKGMTTYMMEGMMKTTGSAVQWLKDNLHIIDDVADSSRLAGSVDDTEGVYFVPAFTGLSSPYWDPHACGIVIGLSRKTTREHVVRAALEGIAYRCKDVLLAMETDTGLPVSSLKADGGASANDFLLQFMADLLGVRVERPVMLDSTALGAAYLAGLASDFWSSTDELREHQKIDRVFEPRMEREKSEMLYEGWKRAVQRSFRWGHQRR